MAASLDASPSLPAYPREPGNVCGRAWPALAEKLLEEFPEATISDVVRELRYARDGVEHLAVAADEALDIASAIARHQLNLLIRRVTAGHSG